MTEMQAAAWISENLTAIYGYAFARLYDKNKVDELVSEIICAVLSSVRAPAKGRGVLRLCVADGRKYVP